MAYCTAAQVQSELKGVTFSATTTPNSTDVARFIAESDAEINTALGQRYTVPVSAGSTTDTMLLLQAISIAIVAGRIRSINATKTGTEAANQGQKSEPAVGSAAWARALLKQILKGDIDLADATLVSSSGGVSSRNVDEDIEPVFLKGEDQW